MEEEPVGRQGLVDSRGGSEAEKKEEEGEDGVAVPRQSREVLVAEPFDCVDSVIYPIF